MKILIIGSKGFIGSNCVKFYKNKNYEVIGCDIIDVKEENYFSLKSLQNDFTKLFLFKVDCCINAAGSANVGYSFDYPEKDFELNVSLVVNLLGAIKNLSPDCKFINFSSAAVYGNPKSLPVKENAETKPQSPYGYHKLLSEKLLLEYHHFFKLKTCSLRVFSAYGPGLKKQLFWDIYQKSEANNDIVLFGTGDESRDFIYISDLVHAVDCILNYGDFCGEVINIASGIETTIADAAASFVNNFKEKKTILFNGYEMPGNPKNWRADIIELEKLGFHPVVKLEEGLSNYFNWVFNH